MHENAHNEQFNIAFSEVSTPPIQVSTGGKRGAVGRKGKVRERR